MTFLNRVTRALEKGLLDAGRTRARRDLLARGDRFLADNGFSRELLERGNGAWPWRVDADTASLVARFAASPAIASAPPRETEREREYARAVAELSAMSDAELDDLGIARANIAEAVRRGRPGIDRPAGGADERIAA